MLLFIQRRTTRGSRASGIQIHLMLLFIRNIQSYGAGIIYSNTSHVIVYPIPCVFSATTCCNSNTSHVIVYQKDVCQRPEWLQFKYISCYCLSGIPDCETVKKDAFKYISCYCLSPSVTLSVSDRTNSNTSHVIVYPGRLCLFGNPFVFKYISCYCLSDLSRKRLKCHSYSNTSHVIVYQIRDKRMLHILNHSNTSHVIVYRPTARAASPRPGNSNTSHVIVYRRSALL